MPVAAQRTPGTTFFDKRTAACKSFYTCLFLLRPEKAFAAAWVATGYFNREHFPSGTGMDRDEAILALDATGMLSSLGVPPDMMVQDMPETVRCRAHA